MSAPTDPVPDGFLCPISHMIMKDPWIDTDGNSYEKEAIMEWLKIQNVSPITRHHLEASQLVPNRGLKDLIDDFVRTHAVSMANSRSTTVFNTNVAPLTRKPIILFAVIDNSGSMGESCGSNGTGEDDGYSRLDLVKHTLNTIITSLTEHDKICIIKFSTVAEVFSQLTVCSKNNQKMIMDSLNYLEPENQTNIWDGMRLAIDMIANVMEDPASNEALIEIYLLTDGEPTINPPGPIVGTIQSALRRKCPNRVPVINTFGYGYKLDSPMLYEIAKCGQGIFGFIPDSTMVGTVFINAMSHSLVGSRSDAATADAVELSMHEDLMGQFVARLISLLETVLDANNDGVKRHHIVEFTTYAKELVDNLPADADLNEFKAFVKDVLQDCADSTDPNLGQIMKASEPDFFTKWGKHYIYSVLSAYERRVCINFKDKGIQHFKSPVFTKEQERVEEVFVSLAPPKPSRNRQQNYGRFGRGGGGGGAPAPAAAAAPAMTRYYNAGGGCYAAESLILTGVEGISSARKACELQRGMTVLSNKGPTTVECVVRLKYSGVLHTVGGLVHLTPYHPVLIGSNSYFPCELPAKTLNILTLPPNPFSESSSSSSSSNGMAKSPDARSEFGSPDKRINGVEGGRPFSGYVYDFVLENRGTLACPYLLASSAVSFASGGIDSVNDGDYKVLYAATFGHDCQVGKFQHEYFGTEAIVQDLKNHSPTGYAMGLIELNNYSYVRNVKNGLVQHMNVEVR